MRNSPAGGPVTPTSDGDFSLGVTPGKACFQPLSRRHTLSQAFPVCVREEGELSGGPSLDPHFLGVTPCDTHKIQSNIEGIEVSQANASRKLVQPVACDGYLADWLNQHHSRARGRYGGGHTSAPMPYAATRMPLRALLLTLAALCCLPSCSAASEGFGELAALTDCGWVKGPELEFCPGDKSDCWTWDHEGAACWPEPVAQPRCERSGRTSFRVGEELQLWCDASAVLDSEKLCLRAVECAP